MLILPIICPIMNMLSTLSSRKEVSAWKRTPTDRHSVGVLLCISWTTYFIHLNHILFFKKCQYYLQQNTLHQHHYQILSFNTKKILLNTTELTIRLSHHLASNAFSVYSCIASLLNLSDSNICENSISTITKMGNCGEMAFPFSRFSFTANSRISSQ